MKEFSITDLAQIMRAEPIKDTTVFTGISVDSRTTKPGDCFFAIAGENSDGHDYIAEAFIKGAVCAVVDKKAKLSEADSFELVRVTDTIKALGRLAFQYRQQCNFKVVAITGSVGKTTTRQIAHHVLSKHFRCYQSPKNYNNNIGLPLTLLAADHEDEIIIAELGSSNPGEMVYLTNIAAPDIAVITNVYPSHLEGFGDLETIIGEKLSIVEGLDVDGELIIGDAREQLVKAAKLKREKFTTFGIKAREVVYKDAGSQFTIDGTQIILPLPGQGNVENALAGWAICSQFGVSIDDFADPVQPLAAIPMRSELLQIGTLTVLNDCYNANPPSMKNALDILVNLGSNEQRRSVFICGDMAELGEHAESLHSELGENIAEAKVELLLGIGKLAKIAGDSAKAHAKHDLQTVYFEDVHSFCNKVDEFIKD